MDGIHDMGAMSGFGPVDATATHSGDGDWTHRLQAVALLSGGVTRPGMEEIDPHTYLGSTYHERWLICSEKRLLEKGKVDEEALVRWQEIFAADADARPPRTENPANVAGVQATLDRTFSLPPAENPRFGVGDKVRVRRLRTESHHRCPRYLRGALGEVEKVPAQDYLPGTRWSQNVVETVYTVRFSSIDLWGDRSDDGEPPYDLFIDLWQSYLEAP